MKVRDIITLVESRGWFLARTRGSHRQFHHSRQPGTVTIAGKPGDDLPESILSSILKQAGMSRKDLK